MTGGRLRTEKPAELPIRELAGGLVVTAAGVSLFLLAGNYELGNVDHPGPAMWPRILAVALAVLGVGIATQGLLGRLSLQEVEAAVPGAWLRVAATGALLVGFVVFWPQLGWVPAGTVAFGLITRLAGASWVVSGLWALAASAALYALFGLLLEIPL